MPTPIIEVKNLTVKYDDRTIIDHINFAVNLGEIFMIVGISGSGKTTVLNRLIGLENPTTGEILIEGDNIVTASAKNRLVILRKVGVLYQSGALFGSMTLLENVKLPLTELTDLPIEAIEIIALNKLKMVGLGDFSNFLPAEVSGGMQKRAALARAIALDPKILFLDEPSSGLDPITASQLDELIVNLARTLNITFVVISHELPSIFKIADRVILLQNGKIIAEGDPKVLKNESPNSFVKKFFNRLN